MSTEKSSGGSAIELFESCAYCDAWLERDVQHPVTVQEDDDGALGIYSFCDHDCQEAWERER